MPGKLPLKDLSSKHCFQVPVDTLLLHQFSPSMCIGLSLKGPSAVGISPPTIIMSITTFDSFNFAK